MPRSLVFKLVLAFLVVSVTGAVLTTLFARWATFREFDRMVLERAQNDFLAEATTYYRAYESWRGVWEYFRPAPPPQPTDRNRPAQQQPPLVFALVDQNGRVVLPAGPYRLGDRVPANELAQGIAVEVDGQVVGTALVTGSPPELDLREEQYLARTEQSSLYAALAAIAIALLLGILLARTLTRPLRELTTATQAMAKGELEQRVPVRSQDELGELATAFNQMSADLARANELRRQMTADIAHDLRTPLTVITGYLESLRDGVLKPSRDRLEVMYNEAQHLTRLVEDLRTLSLADAGELTLNRQRISPGELLERAASAFQHRAEQRRIDLQLRVESELPTVHVDSERMAQVLGNLVSNALRHTPEGGTVALAAQVQADAVLLTVQDDGEGIAPEALPRIFDRFYRGDEARLQQEAKSGLGLAIAKSLVELHGGRITAHSDGIGCGSRFSIHLPTG